MDVREEQTERFEASRSRLRAVAYRLLGSVDEAEDAVQEAWLRLNRADTSGVDNFEGWLTTVVARVCLDMLRSRRLRREEMLDEPAVSVAGNAGRAGDPESEAQLAESVGFALLVVLERLAPAERLAFVLHDMFAVPFEEIGPMVGRTPVAARQLASRARRRVQGVRAVHRDGFAAQRRVVDAFLAALRAGDMEGILAVLDPAVMRRADEVAMPSQEEREIRGRELVAREVVEYRERARFAQTAMVDGGVGVVVAPRGELKVALKCEVSEGKIVAMDVIADPRRLRQLEIAVLRD